MSKVKLVYIILLFSLFLSCDEKKPTESIETAQLTGYVYQVLNGFSNRVPNADISVGEYNTISDSLGLYRIEIPIGEQTIQISHELFDTTIDTINVRGDRSYLVNLLNGPVYSVSGVVTDTLGAVVEGAIVELAHLRDTTDIDGSYEFSDILAGSRILSCDYLDYYLFIDTLEITNSIISKNINLIRHGYNLSGTVSHPVDGLLNGIEVVLDDTLFDTTNINGEYLFENIFVGEHQIQVNSANYNYNVFQFSLVDSDLYKELVISKSTIQKIMIEKDARVSFHGTSNDTTRIDQNYGESSRIGFGYDIVDVFSHSDGTYTYWNYSNRTYMELPPFNNTVDSAFLVLSISTGFIVDTFSIVKISNLASPWEELEITWNTQPQESNQYISLQPSLDDSLRWTIDILEYYDIFASSNGFKMYYPSDQGCYGICLAGNSVYSSEAVEVNKRPYILLYRTQ